MDVIKRHIVILFTHNSALWLINKLHKSTSSLS
jgi:hypothetical protein